MSSEWSRGQQSIGLLVMMCSRSHITSVKCARFSQLVTETDYVNPLRDKFFRRNQNIYLHFMSFLHIDMTLVVEILPQVR